MSLGALTTPFTPAPSCLFTNNVWQISTSVSGLDVPSMIWEQLGAPLQSASGCFPPNYNPASTAYYSPAQCPSGYGPVSSGTSASEGSTVTTHVCCPTIMKFHFLETGTVRSAQPYLTSFLCESFYTGPTTLVVTSSAYGKEPFVTSISHNGGAMNAYGIVVRFQSSDFPSATDAPLTASDAPQGAGSITTFTPTAPPSSGGGGGGLSTGASVGIGVGVGVAGLALIIGAVVLLLRRRKQRIIKDSTVQHGEGQVYHDIQKWEAPMDTPPQEIDSTEHKPLGSSFAPTELEAR